MVTYVICSENSHHTGEHMWVLRDICMSCFVFVQNVYSHTTCPGLVMTNLTYGILPDWFWLLLLPILWLVRFVLLQAAIDILLFRDRLNL